MEELHSPTLEWLGLSKHRPNANAYQGPLVVCFWSVDNSIVPQYALCASGILEVEKLIKQEVQGEARVGHLKHGSNPTTKAHTRESQKITRTKSACVRAFYRRPEPGVALSLERDEQRTFR